MKHTILAIIAASLFYFGCSSKANFNSQQNTENFNSNWQFVKDIDSASTKKIFEKSSNIKWENIEIPHTANLEPLVIKGRQWQGIAYYRKFFTIPLSDKGKHLAINFDGAMNFAEVFLNGKLIHTNIGGYLPFYVEISDILEFGKENCILVKLDNRDNPHIPPGKPIDQLDFNIFSGIYRDVSLIKKNKVHITNAIAANREAAGGIFVKYNNVTEKSAEIEVNVEIENQQAIEQSAFVEIIFFDENDKEILRTKSDYQQFLGNSFHPFKINTKLENPKLWSPNSPNLYTLQVNVYKNPNELLDTESLKIGIRSISFSKDKGFVINGETLKIRGTNRHQEYPYIGYAIGNNANFRDAYKIKQAGFNFVRLSHYPQSPAFLNACDELGILVMNSIPGWQFFGDTIFQQNAISDVRKMVRRDRNHPCVIAWEASLNESEMTKEFMQKAHNAVHSEFPGNYTYTCGWLNSVYDIFIPARQHAKAPDYWNKFSDNKPLLIAEYGDWEYYAQNAGFNQTEFKNLSDEQRNSRQLREHGQKRLAQQALNYQEAHNSNLQGKAVGDANWLMFDYNRGYAPDIEASGIMDIFRLPKFAFYFYQSQTDAFSTKKQEFSKPMVYIANYHNDATFSKVKVYSNCSEVELFLNGKLIAKQKPDNDLNSTYLKHPPFTFNLTTYQQGELKAIGYINGKKEAEFSVKSPKNANEIKIWIDESGKEISHNENDILFLYAAIVDENGTILPDAQNEIKFNIEGEAQLIGNNPAKAEAGIATILLKTKKKSGKITIKANSNNLNGKLSF